jgi:hypothetical protein
LTWGQAATDASMNSNAAFANFIVISPLLFKDPTSTRLGPCRNRTLPSDRTKQVKGGSGKRVFKGCLTVLGGERKQVGVFGGANRGQTANFRQKAPEIHVRPQFAAHAHQANKSCEFNESRLHKRRSTVVYSPRPLAQIHSHGYTSTS